MNYIICKKILFTFTMAASLSFVMAKADLGLSQNHPNLSPNASGESMSPSSAQTIRANDSHTPLMIGSTILSSIPRYDTLLPQANQGVLSGYWWQKRPFLRRFFQKNFGLLTLPIVAGVVTWYALPQQLDSDVLLSGKIDSYDLDDSVLIPKLETMNTRKKQKDPKNPLPPPPHLDLLVFEPTSDRDQDSQSENYTHWTAGPQLSQTPWDMSVTLTKKQDNTNAINEEWFAELTRTFYTLSPEQLSTLGQKFFIPTTHHKEMHHIMTEHFKHIHTSLQKTIYLAFVLELGSIKLTNFSTEHLLDINHIAKIEKKLADELVFYLFSIPKSFSSRDELNHYQKNIILILKSWTMGTLNEPSIDLYPIKDSFMATLKHPHIADENLEILYYHKVLGMPEMIPHHFHDLLGVSQDELQTLQHRRDVITQKSIIRTIGLHSDDDLHHHFFHLSSAEISALHSKYREAWHLDSLREYSFYHELKSFYLQIMNHDLRKRLFLSFIIQLEQPTVTLIHQLATTYELTMIPKHDQNNTSSDSIHDESILAIRRELSSLMRDLQNWLHRAEATFIYQSFDTIDGLHDYYQERLKALHEKELSFIGRSLGIVSQNKLNYWPQTFFKLMSHDLDNMVDFIIFCAYILHWNAMPVSKFAELHQMTKSQVKQRRERLRRLLQQYMNGPSEEGKTLEKTIEKFVEQFDGMSKSQLKLMTSNLSLDHIPPKKFRRLVREHLLLSSYGQVKLILFFAKVLSMSTKSYLEWDQIFSESPLKKTKSSIILHLEMEQKFYHFLQQHQF
ncbi:MAG: hypothetical protein OXC40_00760 [Proteobacteria bacterium]|nr:hypothetical protein [Pseudomonadota bacterium]